MRLVELKISGFRGYVDPVTLVIDPEMTALVGKNDSGKSTILEALNAFFSDRKMTDRDFPVNAGRDIQIECCFDEVPERVILDYSVSTTLDREYLLDSEKRLRIRKVWTGATAPKNYVVCSHPLNSDGATILNLTLARLRTLAMSMDCDPVEDARVASKLRTEIWKTGMANGDLTLVPDCPVELTAEFGKKILEAIKKDFPKFYLFTADRPASEDDHLAQDPIRLVVEAVLSRHAEELSKLTESVAEEIQGLLAQVGEEMMRLAPSIVGQIEPVVGDPKWSKAFGASGLIDGNSVPVQNRGSGVRRLVLMSFFRAQMNNLARLDAADDASAAGNLPSAIIAMEEPETALHPDLQRELITSLLSAAAEVGQQLVITTHSSNLVQSIPVAAVRYITLSTDKRVIESVVDHEDDYDFLGKIHRSLGIFSDHTVKCFLLVEGRNDMEGLKRLTKWLARNPQTGVVDFESAERAGHLKILPFGGCGAAALWSGKLRDFRRPEFVLLDSDRGCATDAPSSGAREVQQKFVWEHQRVTILSRREMENYLSLDAIMASLPTEWSQVVSDSLRAEWNNIPPNELDYLDVPNFLARTKHQSGASHTEWPDLEPENRSKKESRAKKILVEAFAEENCLRPSSDDDLMTLVNQISSVLKQP